jgi:hypothetical protein
VGLLFTGFIMARSLVLLLIISELKVMYQLGLLEGGRESYLSTLKAKYEKLATEVQNSSLLTAEEKKVALIELAEQFKKFKEESYYSLF